MKKSGYLQRVQAARQKDFIDTQRFTRQLTADIMQLTLNRVFGFGKERIKRFVVEYSTMFDEIAEVWNGDEAGKEYARDLIDRGLKQIFGDDFVCWEERYDFKIPR